MGLSLIMLHLQIVLWACYSWLKVLIDIWLCQVQLHFVLLVIKFLPAVPGQSQEGQVMGSSHLCKTPYPPQAAWLQPPVSQQQWRAAGSEKQREK